MQDSSKSEKFLESVCTLPDGASSFIKEKPHFDGKAPRACQVIRGILADWLKDVPPKEFWFFGCYKLECENLSNNKIKAFFLKKLKNTRYIYELAGLLDELHMENIFLASRISMEHYEATKYLLYYDGTETMGILPGIYYQLRQGKKIDEVVVKLQDGDHFLTEFEQKIPVSERIKKPEFDILQF